MISNIKIFSESIYSLPIHNEMNAGKRLNNANEQIPLIKKRIEFSSQNTTIAFSLFPSAIKFPTPAPVLSNKLDINKLILSVMMV